MSIWFKIWKYPLGKIGLIWVVLCSIVALSGYLILPDKSPNASRIALYAAFEPPFTKVKQISLKKENKLSTWEIWLHGDPSAAESFLFSHLTFSEDSFFLWYNLQENTNSLVFSDQIQSLTKYKIQSFTFYLGSDALGRDVFSRILLGTRISLSVGIIAVFISVFLGTMLGLIAGYYGGVIDKLIMWFASVLWSIPTLLLVLSISFALGKGFWQIFIAIGIGSWVELTRIVRGEVLSIKQKEYIHAVRLLGVSNFSILTKHILPNLLPSITVIAASNFASAILLESGLSFLGLGVKPPTPSWGIMIQEYFGFIVLDKAYLALVPGFVIMSLVTSVNFIGMALREGFEK
jgi:peptide/nickel transport system permease protein